jgi:hypothetical protein
MPQAHPPVSLHAHSHLPDRDGAHTITAPRCKDGSSIEDLIESFVLAKFARTQSSKTAKVYSETITTFRTTLQKQGMDLVMYTSDQIADYDVIRVRIAEVCRLTHILAPVAMNLSKKETRPRYVSKKQGCCSQQVLASLQTESRFTHRSS